MRHSIKSMMFMGAFMCGLSMCLISCEDILGHWEKPTPANVTPSGGDDGGGDDGGSTPSSQIGKFTINAGGDQVQFSPGNLQYNSSEATYKWRFAEHQYDYVGAWNTTTWVDLFGWGTWTGAATNPINVSTTNSQYTWDAADFTQESKLADESQRSYDWRTLTGGDDGEWKYLLNTRTTGGTVFGTASARYAHATINTDGTAVNGLILFPDGVDIAASEVTTAGAVNGTSAWGTECTSAQWTALADKGCVFLPAAGFRDGTTVLGVGTNGDYWSSSPHGSAPGGALLVGFGSNYLSPGGWSDRFNGFSVRLVRPAE